MYCIIQWLYENPTMNIHDSIVSSYVLTILNGHIHSKQFINGTMITVNLEVYSTKTVMYVVYV